MENLQRSKYLGIKSRKIRYVQNFGQSSREKTLHILEIPKFHSNTM